MNAQLHRAGFSHDPRIVEYQIMKLWQHDETGRLCWSGSPLNPQRFTEVPTMYEDELPEPMSDEDYRKWFGDSKVVDGVRVGPKVSA